MLQAAGTAEGDNGFSLATHLKHAAVVKHLDMAPHRSQGLKLPNLLIDSPAAPSSEKAQLLQRHRLQIVARGGRRGGLAHFLPLGSNGSRLVVAGAPPAVAVAGCICLSRICCRFSGRASRVSKKVCSPWKILATTM